MPELTREEKLKLVEKLSQQLQDLLYSEDTGAFLLYLGQKYNLPDEKVRLLSKLVADIVLGIVPITSLAQEINSKITSDAQVAMNLAQELNTELLAPAMVSAPSAPATPAPTPAPSIDRYREPTVGPEIVDLRKTPPVSVPVAPKPILSIPMPTPAAPLEPITPPRPITPPTPITPISPALPTESRILDKIGTKPITPPLTFTRPIEPTKPAPPLIEAEPHKIPPSALKPQYIMRPSGLPPTDLPDNVLDLRKDRGEF